MNATLVVKEFLNGIIDTAYGVHCPFYPGRFAATSGNDAINAVYMIIPNNDYTQPYIHLDAMRIELNHSKFLKLQAGLDAILALNKENPWDVTGLPALMAGEGFRLHDLIVRVSNVNPNDFIEGTDYFTGVVDILVHYAKL